MSWRLYLYTFAHFWVDFTCFFILFSWVATNQYSDLSLTIGILSYNILAFGLQPLIGYLCDCQRKIPVTFIGFSLLALGLLLRAFFIPTLILIGLGNACFHVGGGSDSLRYSQGKMSRSGIFVSSGAIGVICGTLAGKSQLLAFYWLLLILGFCFVILWYLDKKTAVNQVTEVIFPFIDHRIKASSLLLLAAISIAIRYYGTAIIPLAWAKVGPYSFFPALGACLGKASGGIIADRYGAKSTALISLALSLIFIAGGYNSPYLYLIGIGLYNMNMAITLCAIAAKLPAYPGLAFGLTTLALLCGNVPTFFWRVSQYLTVFVILVIGSLACLCYILSDRSKRYEKTSKSII